MRIFRAHPDSSDMPERKKNIRARILIGSLAAAGLGVGVYGVHEHDLTENAGTIAALGIVVSSIVILLPIASEFHERYAKPKNGPHWDKRSWEPPEQPEPDGPSGIIIDARFIQDIEDYLKEQVLVSV